MSKSWRCRLGFHQWYVDGAMFTHASRCNRCDAWENAYAARMLQRERAAWEYFGETSDPGKIATALFSEPIIYEDQDDDDA